MAEYIEREAVLKDIEEMLDTAQQHINITGRGFGKTLWAGIYKGINFCKTKLLAAPAGDVVEVRHGRWEERSVNVDTPTTDLFCSECNFASYHWRYNYCPNCGCKMDKEE